MKINDMRIIRYSYKLNLNGVDLKVLLSWFMGDTYFDQTTSQIAKELGIAKSSVSRAFKNLKNLDILEVTKLVQLGKGWKTPVYEFTESFMAKFNTFCKETRTSNTPDIKKLRNIKILKDLKLTHEMEIN